MTLAHMPMLRPYAPVSTSRGHNCRGVLYHKAQPPSAGQTMVLLFMPALHAFLHSSRVCSCQRTSRGLACSADSENTRAALVQSMHDLLRDQVVVAHLVIRWGQHEQCDILLNRCMCRLA